MRSWRLRPFWSGWPGRTGFTPPKRSSGSTGFWPFATGLDPFAAAKLRSEAEEVEREAPDTVRFTRALKDAVALEDRAELMTALWSVALADGLREAHEDRLMRLVANLLGLTDVDSALARQTGRTRNDRQPWDV